MRWGRADCDGSQFERKNLENFVSAYRNMEVVGVKCRSRKIWGECVNQDMN